MSDIMKHIAKVDISGKINLNDHHEIDPEAYLEFDTKEEVTEEVINDIKLYYGFYIDGLTIDHQNIEIPEEFLKDWELLKKRNDDNRASQNDAS